MMTERFTVHDEYRHRRIFPVITDAAMCATLGILARTGE
jgi:hypothetical protein